MVDTGIHGFTDGVTANATDEIAAVRSPYGAGDDRKLTPAYIKDYILGLANTFTRGQTITQGTANEAILTSTGFSLTGSNAQSMIDLAGTLNTSGAPTLFKMNLTDTASDAATLFADWQIGGSSRFKVNKLGRIDLSNGTKSTYLILQNATSNFAISDIFNFCIDGGGAGVFNITGGLETISCGNFGAGDVFLSRSAAAVWQLGLPNAASPVAQTLRAQGSRGGTDSNVGGANLTLHPGTGTGTGTAASLILKSPVLVASGSGAQTQTDSVTCFKAGAIVGAAALATDATDGFLYIPTCAGTPTGTPTAFTGRVALVYDTTNDQFWIYDAGWKQPKTPAGAAIVTWQ